MLYTVTIQFVSGKSTTANNIPLEAINGLTDDLAEGNLLMVTLAGSQYIIKYTRIVDCDED